MEPNLDITNYLSSPNIVNCCNPHVGTCYRVIFKNFTTLPEENTCKYTKESHKMNNFIEAFDQTTGKARQALFMDDWPKIDIQLPKNILINITLKPIQRVVHVLFSLRNGMTAALLGKEYQTFFDLVKGTTIHVDPADLTDKHVFKLEYRARYRPRIPKAYCLHRRHIPQKLYEPLEKLCDTDALSTYGLKKANKDYILKIEKDKRFPLFLDALMRKGDVWLKKLVKEKSNTLLRDAPQDGDMRNKTNFEKVAIEKKHLLGRKEDLASLHRCFTQKKYHLQVILGDGGMGKSTLARLYVQAYFSRQQKHGYTHAWWLDAEDATALACSIDDIARKMGIREANDYANPKQRWERIEAQLQKYPGWLLVFDNALNPAQLRPYFSTAQHGHILITSRHRKSDEWSNENIHPFKIEQISLPLAKQFLEGFRPSNGHTATRDQLLDAIQKRLPFTLSLIGHCLQNKNTFPTRPYRSPYQSYLNLYKKTQRTIDPQAKSLGKKGVPHLSMAVAFDITAQKIQEEMTQKTEKNTFQEAWRILRVMSFLHPDGLDWTFFHYLRPSLKGKWLKSQHNDRQAIIKGEKARNAIRYLCSYGILIDEGDTSRAHRTIQALMRLRIQKKGIANHIQDQALQLLETMQKQDPLAVAKLKFEMAAHCRTLMHHIQQYKKKRFQLLRLMSQIDGQAYLRSNLYLPPASHQWESAS